MLKIGITGQAGFVGTHLCNTIGLYQDEFQIVPFDKKYFLIPELLENFVSQCDVIVHLAAVNRHHDPSIIYKTNVDLAQKLVDALELTQSNPHIIFSSSTQEERDNQYGKSKKVAREVLYNWSRRNGGKFTGLIIPNVFGPFGNPFYNSVIATFCHQIARGENTIVEIDGNLKLIYVSELVEEIIRLIRNNDNTNELFVPSTSEAKVSEILTLLNYFRDSYQDKGYFPILHNDFEYKLFNTYRCYMDLKNYFPRKFTQNTDNRGVFVEIARHGIPGQTSFSTTLSGVTRGNHFHTRKIERFAVIKGRALIKLRRIGTDDVHYYYLDGDNPAYVDMPIWYTHNIENIGEDTLYTIFWINEAYDANDSDTYFQIV